MGTIVIPFSSFASTKLGFESRSHTPPNPHCYMPHILACTCGTPLRPEKLQARISPKPHSGPWLGLQLTLPGGASLWGHPIHAALLSTSLLVTFLLDVLSCSETPQAFSYKPRTIISNQLLFMLWGYSREVPWTLTLPYPRGTWFSVCLPNQLITSPWAEPDLVLLHLLTEKSRARLRQSVVSGSAGKSRTL